jgi:hypothetical protein
METNETSRSTNQANCRDEEEDPEEPPPHEILGKLIQQSQKNFPIELTIYHTIDQHNIVRLQDRAVIHHHDRETKQKILELLHSRTHYGVTATHAEVSRLVVWKKMRADVKQYVQNCNVCQVSRTNRTVRTTAGHALRLEDIEKIPVGAIVGIDVVVVDSIDDQMDTG